MTTDQTGPKKPYKVKLITVGSTDVIFETVGPLCGNFDDL